jgi:ankyrin repeat protein
MNKEERSLMVAVITDEYKEAKEMLERGISLHATDYDGHTPLHLAVIMNNFRMSKLLIEHGANIYAESNKKLNPLHLSVIYDSIECAEVLLEHGFEVNKPNPINVVLLAQLLKKEKMIQVLSRNGRNN